MQGQKIAVFPFSPLARNEQEGVHLARRVFPDDFGRVPGSDQRLDRLRYFVTASLPGAASPASAGSSSKGPNTAPGRLSRPIVSRTTC